MIRSINDTDILELDIEILIDGNKQSRHDDVILHLNCNLLAHQSLEEGKEDHFTDYALCKIGRITTIAKDAA